MLFENIFEYLKLSKIEFLFTKIKNSVLNQLTNHAHDHFLDKILITFFL